jgi:hypothetical protein
MIKTIAIIIVSVSIFGLLVFVFVRNQIQKRLNYYVKQERKKKSN